MATINGSSRKKIGNMTTGIDYADTAHQWVYLRSSLNLLINLLREKRQRSVFDYPDITVERLARRRRVLCLYIADSVLFTRDRPTRNVQLKQWGDRVKGDTPTPTPTLVGASSSTYLYVSVSLRIVLHRATQGTGDENAVAERYTPNGTVRKRAAPSDRPRKDSRSCHRRGVDS